MNNQHEIAMVMDACGKAIHSRAKAVKTYRKYAQEANAWADQALVKANTAERQRFDNAVVISLCLFAVTLFVITAVVTIVPLATIISYCGAAVFFVTALAYTYQEYRFRNTQKGGGLNVIA